MNNSSIPLSSEIPSMKSLIKLTVVAICAVVILTFTVILPAEYGIDITGIGKAIGLTRMGEIKSNLAAEAANDRTMETVTSSLELPVKQVMANEQPSANASAEKHAATSIEKNVREDKITITLSPDEGKEVKLEMNKDDQVEYLWWSDGGKVNFDCHADSKPLKIKYHGYGKGSLQRSEGTLSAAFDGNHGWFWRNRTSEIVTVVLQVKGLYSEIIEMK